MARQGQANAAGRARLWAVPMIEAAEGQRARAAARVRRTQAVVQHGRARAGEAVGCGFCLSIRPSQKVWSDLVWFDHVWGEV